MKQASLILRVIKDNELYYFVQQRDNIENAPFIFPGAFSLFGGAVEEGETPEQAIKREMEEELPNMKINRFIEHRCYNWDKEDIDTVETDIAESFNHNFRALRGFNYGDLVPEEALGKHRKEVITYLEFISSVEEDHLFIADCKPEDVLKLKVKEGERGLLLPASVCVALVFCPTDKLALMHDYSKYLTEQEHFLANAKTYTKEQDVRHEASRIISACGEAYQGGSDFIVVNLICLICDLRQKHFDEATLKELDKFVERFK